MKKKLFKSAYESLKPKGIMVYSTCTLNTEENEQVLQWAIDNLNIKIIDINIQLKDKLPITSEGVDNQIQKSLKILPSKTQEGFFVAKLEKL